MNLRQGKWPLWIGCISLISAIVWQIVKALKWGHDSWPLTDWLINYHGGFVRRGLPGEAIFLISSWFGIQANYLVIALSLALYIFLLFYLLNKTKNNFLPLLILSPAVMGGPALQDFIVRKDILGILFLLASIKILSSDIRILPKLIVVNLISIIAILSHESFFFFAIPAIFLIICNLNSQKTISRARQLFNTTISVLPSFIAFVLTAVYKGKTKTAYAINDSWIDLWRSIEPAHCCLDQPAGAIHSIQWTLKYGLSLSASIFTHFSWGIYVPAAWMLTILACGIFLLSFSKNLSKIECQNFSKIIIFQLLMISPLFILGWDFGRWIFLWTSSSLILFINGLNINSINLLNFYNPSSFMGTALHKRIAENEWLLLIFGTPICCWTLALFVESGLLSPYIALSRKIIWLYMQ